VTDADLADLTALWDRRHSHRLPLGHALGRDSEEWVRFHSLPGSKRYADTEKEYHQILHRHFTIRSATPLMACPLRTLRPTSPIGRRRIRGGTG
jgi:hypothetical protein